MKLQILINHYHEDEEIIGRLLKSIEEQTLNKDNYEVIIGNDGYENKLNERFINKFSFSLRQLSGEHRGVCMTRNMLLDIADATYIMFCDADDMFIKSEALETMLTVAEEKKLDFVGCAYYGETSTGCRYCMPKDIIRLHCKIFRKEYIDKYNFRFPDELKISGDTSFLWPAYNMTTNKIWLPDYNYFWRWNPNSVTRSDRKNHFTKSYQYVIRNYEIATETLIKYNREDLVKKLIGTLFSMMYLDLHSGKLDRSIPEYFNSAKDKVEQCVYKYYDVYKNIEADYRKNMFDNYKKYRELKKDEYRFEDVIPWIDSIVNNHKK